jgi:hypothetical protein
MVFGRSKAWKGDFSKLQREMSTISRVVVHPKYRSVGLGAKLVGETLDLAGTPYVEMVAVMAKYNPFAEKAGMKRIAEQSAPKEALRIAEVLEQLGFNNRLLGCEKLSQNNLTRLSEENVNKIKETFAANAHPRLMKYFTGHEVFVNKPAYAEQVRKASPAKLAHLIKVSGFLLQTKIYLFWKQPKKKERRDTPNRNRRVNLESIKKNVHSKPEPKPAAIQPRQVNGALEHHLAPAPSPRNISKAPQFSAPSSPLPWAT